MKVTYDQTPEVPSLNDLANGALNEQFIECFAEVIKNIADLKTVPDKARKVAISITIKPNKDRNFSLVTYDVKSTLAPQEGLQAHMHIGVIGGKVQAAETITNQLGLFSSEESKEEVEQLDD